MSRQNPNSKRLQRSRRGRRKWAFVAPFHETHFRLLSELRSVIKSCPNLQSMSYLKTIIYLIVKILEPLYSGGSFYKIAQEPPSKNKTSSSVSGCTLYPLDSSFLVALFTRSKYFSLCVCGIITSLKTKIP